MARAGTGNTELFPNRSKYANRARKVLMEKVLSFLLPLPWGKLKDERVEVDVFVVLFFFTSSTVDNLRTQVFQ